MILINKKVCTGRQKSIKGWYEPQALSMRAHFRVFFKISITLPGPWFVLNLCLAGWPIFFSRCEIKTITHREIDLCEIWARWWRTGFDGWKKYAFLDVTWLQNIRYMSYDSKQQTQLSQARMSPWTALLE